MPLGYIILLWSGRFPRSNSRLDFPSPDRKCQWLCSTPSLRLLCHHPLPFTVTRATSHFGGFIQRALSSWNPIFPERSLHIQLKRHFCQVLPGSLQTMSSILNVSQSTSSFSVPALSSLSCNYLPCVPLPYRLTTSEEHVLIISLLWEPVTVPGTGWCPVSS